LDKLGGIKCELLFLYDIPSLERRRWDLLDGNETATGVYPTHHKSLGISGELYFFAQRFQAVEKIPEVLWIIVYKTHYLIPPDRFSL
jgi:hypothetical protein